MIFTDCPENSSWVERKNGAAKKWRHRIALASVSVTSCPSFKSAISRKTALPLILGIFPFLSSDAAYAISCPSPVSSDTTISASCTISPQIDWTGGSLTISGLTTIVHGDVYGVFSTDGHNVGNLTNNGTITTSSYPTGYYAVLALGTASISSIINNNGGTISGPLAALAWSTPVGIIENHGVIEATDPVYGVAAIINSDGNIGTINNYSGGIITSLSRGSGIDNGEVGLPGSINVINNYGVISGSGGSYGINNSFGGTITTLTNAQGGDSSTAAKTALTYTGTLPTNYYVAISSTTHYGQLQVTNAQSPSPTDPTAKMTFGVYSGSALAYLKHRYASVLSSTDGSLNDKIANMSGTTASGRKWRLIDNGDNTYDLEIDGYIVVRNVYSTLNSNRDALLGAMHERYAVLNTVSQYDCNRFDKYGVCISIQARATGWGSQTTGAGVFNIAYHPHEKIHAGVYLDYQVAQGTPFGTNLGSGGIQYGYNNPTFGGYVGFSQSGYNGTPVNAGLQAFMSGGYNPGKVTITRAWIDGTEPGQGTAGLNAYYAYGTLGYGFNVADRTILAPYAGLFYTNVIRNSYNE